MDVAQMMADLATAVGTVGGFNQVHAFPPDAINPPTAVVVHPDIDYQTTYGPGTSRATISVWCFTDKTVPSERAEVINGWQSRTGATSIPAAIHAATLSNGLKAQVVRSSYDPETFSGLEYLGIEFVVDVVG